ncbi:DUF5709 domain-containing protein [Streptomyces sp. DG2A-72]|uniref:DUF5709 domain-containing protein n=1 Tax=Streptomyces sp. DG2A-72 TaxID=3051386 RepID=UPI00265C4119|nr:DUF5709 domain-containing protein [Streptomyces sp. DG2A-72]MDO0931408.1 DUF5709 domain-containing protein [Streptomyces sp. DG2A-72]
MPDEQREYDDESMGDEVYQPDDSEVQDDAGVMDPEDTLDDRGIDPAIDEGYSPPEKPLAVQRRGTTAAEQRERDSLDERLQAERPDTEPPPGDEIGDVPDGEGEPVDAEAGDRRAGRLTAAAEGAETQDDTVAEDAGIAGGAASSEEAAVHVVDNPAESDDEGSRTA